MFRYHSSEGVYRVSPSVRFPAKLQSWVCFFFVFFFVFFSFIFPLKEESVCFRFNSVLSRLRRENLAIIERWLYQEQTIQNQGRRDAGVWVPSVRGLVPPWRSDVGDSGERRRSRRASRPLHVGVGAVVRRSQRPLSCGDFQQLAFPLLGILPFRVPLRIRAEPPVAGRPTELQYSGLQGAGGRPQCWPAGPADRRMQREPALRTKYGRGRGARAGCEPREWSG